METKIENVSDTALWVAHFRAVESERPDAVFHDVLAARLVGERGRKIAEMMPMGKFMAWMMVIRTSAIDELIQRAIAQNIDCVLNLGAGLDTRPYRMSVPASLAWIEIDQASIIDLKNEKLKGEITRCHLERFTLDLSDPLARAKIFADICQRYRRILVITEGVIPYLSNAEATTLARDLHSHSEFEFWIQDYYDGGLKNSTRKMSSRMKASPMRFDAPNWLAFFNHLNWQTFDVITVHDEAIRLRRPLPFMFPISILVKLASLFPKKWQEREIRKRGYVLFRRN